MDDVLRKALDAISLGYSQGDCSVDILIKACENYKIKKGLVDDFDYDLKVAKSCIDSINGVEQDIEIAKAIVPGQTKVVDGVMYIYSATKAGSKNQYDWHVVKTGSKTKKKIGRGSKLKDDSISGKQKYINELFPKDLSSLKTIKRLGGSTGAQLVEDIDGNQYVLKKGSNTNSEHVRSEYLSNQLYNILGLKTPDYELYDDNGESVLLSRYIQGTHVPNSSDFKKMSEGFIADVLLANWDVYQNDNCLVKNANGEIYRVDNGGCLDFRAQGKKKTFDDNVLDTWESMSKYNPGISNILTEDDQLSQIESILKKKDDVVNYLKESGKDDLAKILSERFDNLKQISDKLNLQKLKNERKISDALKKIKSRKLKSDDEMYRDLDKKTLDDIVDRTSNTVGCKSDDDYILTYTGKRGWEMLSNVCKARGFDARPLVVPEKEFWKLRKTTKYPLMMRGFEKVEYKDEFCYSDSCHYGMYGVWGQGIYAHSDDKSTWGKTGDQHSPDFVDNKSDESNWKNSPIYSKSIESAMEYSFGDKNAISKMVWAPDAKIVNSEDLLDEIKSMGVSSNNPKVKKLKSELDKIKKEWTENSLALQNIDVTIKKKVYSDMHYDETAVENMMDYLQGVNWGSRNAQGKRNYPMFQEAVIEHLKPCVEKCGGTAEVINKGEVDERIHFSIGGQDLYISKYSWEHNAVKQKNQFSNPYHYQAEKFKVFFDTNCIKRVQQKIDAELYSGKLTKSLQEKVNKNKNDYLKKEKEYNDATALSGGSNDVYSRIYNIVKKCDYHSNGNSNKSLLGLYAALKGYDGIYQPNGNGSGHGFMIILNRSKIITSI